MRKKLITGSILVIVLLVALLTRLGAVIVPLKDFDSDEAVVGLMARDILAGESWPVFYAGQSYLGALEPWSVAASFALLGESAFSLRLVPLLYSLTFLLAAYFLLRRFFRPLETGLILLWTALGTPFFNLWTVKARGGFAEVLLLGTLFLLLFERCWRRQDPGAAGLVALGTVAGFALFVNPLVGTIMLVPLALLVTRALAESRPLFVAEGWSINGLILFRPLRGRLRAVFLALAGVGLLALALAAPLILADDAALESWTGMNYPEGTPMVLYAAFYFALLYLTELALLSRSRPGGIAGFLKRLWESSAGLRMLLAIAAGHMVFSIASSLAVAWAGGGGHGQPFRLAPVIAWPERLFLLFGQVVPTAFWPLAGGAGPLMAALCVLLAVLLLQRRRELGLADDGRGRWLARADPTARVVRRDNVGDVSSGCDLGIRAGRKRGPLPPAPAPQLARYSVPSAGVGIHRPNGKGRPVCSSHSAHCRARCGELVGAMPGSLRGACGGKQACCRPVPRARLIRAWSTSSNRGAARHSSPTTGLRTRWPFSPGASSLWRRPTVPTASLPCPLRYDRWARMLISSWRGAPRWESFAPRRGQLKSRKR